MKAELVNPFLVECQSIFREAAGIDLSYKGTAVKSSPISTKDLVVLIGITGALRGSVVLNLNEEFARKIASNMMGGMEISELNELAKSAIAELANMIMGRVSTTLYGKNIEIDITPPSIMIGTSIALTLANKPVLSIKFLYDNYDLDFDISVND